MEKENILQGLKNKRVIVGFVTPRGQLEMTVARFEDSDANFIKIKTIQPDDDPQIIKPGLHTYIAIPSVDSIIDADDEATFNALMDKFAEQRESAQQAMAQQQARAKAQADAAAAEQNKPAAEQKADK
jgi:hypothetical protein